MEMGYGRPVGLAVGCRGHLRLLCGSVAVTCRRQVVLLQRGLGVLAKLGERIVKGAEPAIGAA